MITEMALDPFAGRQRGKASQSVNSVDALPDTETRKKIERNLDLLVRYFHHQTASLTHPYSAYESDYDREKAILQAVSSIPFEVLKPKAIEQFYGVLLSRADTDPNIYVYFKRPFFRKMAEPTLTKLIQDSYNHGNNNFYSNFGENGCSDLGEGLSGTQDRPLVLTVGGKSFYSSFSQLENVKVHIHGSVSISCYPIKNSSIEVHGNADREFGRESKKSTFIIHGNVGEDCGYRSSKCDFTIYGNTGDLPGNLAWKSKFRMHGNVGKNLEGGGFGNRYYVSSDEIRQRMKKEFGFGGRYILGNRVEVLR